ncbi:MAG: glycosyltransferase family 4 protein [Candidatus Helarchaeota archaeon]
MEICLISSSLVQTPPYFGGAIETFTYELGCALAKLKNHVWIITRNGIAHKIEKDPNLKIISIKIPRFRIIRGMCYNLTIGKLASILNFIDIYHTQGTSVFPSIYITSKIRGVPVLHTEHVYYPWISVSKGKLSRRVRYPFEISLGKFTLQHAQKIVVANRILKKALLAKRPALKSQIEIIPQGINPKLFNMECRRSEIIQKKYGFSKKDQIILYVGRLTREKNVESLIKAVSELKQQNDEIKLLLVGPKGPQFPWNKVDRPSNYVIQLEKWVQQKGLSKTIIFTGPIPYDKMPKYYASSDLLVQPSSFETFGRTIFEAICMGIPYICRQVGEFIPEYFPRTSATFLKEINVTTLTEAIKNMLENQTKFKTAGLIEGRKICTQYNWTAIAKRYLEKYEELIKN